MNPMPRIARILVSASVLAMPVLAQAPLFTDGPAFGGSQIFSEGMNPLANPARFGQAPQGWYFTYLDGDQRAHDNRTILGNAASSDPAAASAALAQLGGAPWAQRNRDYGFARLKENSVLALTREEMNSILGEPDLAPSHLNGGLGANTSTLDGRRAVVNRLSLGAAGPASQGASLGVNLRIERWDMGQRTAAYHPAAGQFTFNDPDSDLLGFTGTSARAYQVGLDLGLDAELATGVRLGAMVTQLNAKRLWDVDMKPQFRAGLQIDLGTMAKLNLEGDLNGAQRMPFGAVKQQSNAASLRILAGPSAVLNLGLEQRKVDGVSFTRAGATLQIRMPSVLLAFGFNAGQDRPMKGGTFMVN